jgi:hypothetical protein
MKRNPAKIVGLYRFLHRTEKGKAYGRETERDGKRATSEIYQK